MMKPNAEGRKERNVQQKVCHKCPENLGPAKDIKDTASQGLHETRAPKHLSPIQKDADGKKKSPQCLLPWSRSINSYVIQYNTLFPGPSSTSKITSVQELPHLNRHTKPGLFFQVSSCLWVKLCPVDVSWKLLLTLLGAGIILSSGEIQTVTFRAINTRRREISGQ